MPSIRYYDHGNGDFRPYLPAHKVNLCFGKAPAVHLDFSEPVSIPGTNEAWRSKSERREYMKRGGFEEVGDQAPSWMKERRYNLDHGMEPGERVDPVAEAPVDEGVHFEMQDFEGEG